MTLIRSASMLQQVIRLKHNILQFDVIILDDSLFFKEIPEQKIQRLAPQIGRIEILSAPF